MFNAERAVVFLVEHQSIEELQGRLNQIDCDISAFLHIFHSAFPHLY
mgnify:CR=1 FL=1